MTGIISLAGVAGLTTDASTLFDGLTGRGAPEILVAAFGVSLTIVMIAQGYTRLLIAAALDTVIVVPALMLLFRLVATDQIG